MNEHLVGPFLEVRRVVALLAVNAPVRPEIGFELCHDRIDLGGRNLGQKNRAEPSGIGVTGAQQRVDSRASEIR
jgi:hypothetical protein